MSKYLIYEKIQTEAIFNVLNKTDLYFFRKICRWYSKTFSTPLKDVLDGKIIQWDEILLHYYESQMENMEYNQVYNIAVEEYLPELSDEREIEDQAFADALVEEQKRTMEAKDKKEVLKNKTEETKKPPEMSLSFGDEEL